jgi:pectate lyase
VKARHFALIALAGSFAASALAANRPAGYVTICTEGKTCSVATATNVAFGRADQFFYKVLTGSFVCNEATFGGRVAGGTDECSVPGGSSSSSSSKSSSSSTPSSSSSSSSTPSSSSSSSSVPSSSSSSSSSVSSTSTNPAGLVGFAAVNANGLATTTGGAGGPTVVVTTYAELVAAIADHSPRIVKVSGTITNGGTTEMIPVGSNKTIVGVGANATLNGFGLNVSGWREEMVKPLGQKICEVSTEGKFEYTKNVIIRNLNFVNAGDDNINVQCWSHHVWLDHNTFNKPGDGSVDIKRGSDWVTVSWNKFIDTDKTMLLSHDNDAQVQDTGKLHVSYHHNWFNGSRQRMPRVRFGQAHVFNNWCDNPTSTNNYMIGVGMSANIYADGNYVNCYGETTQDMGDAGPLAKLTWDASNLIVLGKGVRFNTGNAFVPRSFYNYTLDPAANIPTILQQGAGAGVVVN